MKKIVLAIGLVCALTGTVYADGNAFTPLDFNDTTYGTSSSNKASVSSKNTTDIDAIGNSNIQNAIQQLDNAQIDIRNELLNVKTKYADIDAQYKLIKTERNALKKQVRSVERRIKDIDNAKEKIRKNMI